MTKSAGAIVQQRNVVRKLARGSRLFREKKKGDEKIDRLPRCSILTLHSLPAPYFTSVLTDVSCVCVFSFSREQKRQFQELVEVKFHEWLLETGHRQELDSLIPPAMASLRDSSGIAAAEAPRVPDAKPTRNGRAVGQSPMAC